MLGLGGLMVSAVSRVAVAGPTQIEAEGYAGSSVGQWTCGPSARANYGGVGGQIRVYTDDRVARPPEDVPSNGGAAEEAALDIEPHGFWLGGGGGGEYRAFTRTACSDRPCSTNDVIPPSRLLAGGRASFGYDWDYFGMRAGALVFQRWASNVDGSPTSVVLPDASLRFGRRLGFHSEVGFGAYDVATVMRPGLYVGLGYASGAWAADVRGGVHQTFDDQAGLRLDLSARYAVSRVVAPGLGIAVSSAQQISPEGRLFLVFTP